MGKEKQGVAYCHHKFARSLDILLHLDIGWKIIEYMLISVSKPLFIFL